MRKERIKALLVEAGVDYEDYYKYLQMNRKCVQVVLQRDISEIYINAYNIEWLEEWDGNIDIQPVGDFFGVITYVTEYAFKPEPEEMAIRRALETCNDKDMESKMKVIAQSFQDNRQMGEAEATYKILPNLTMTMSNVGKQWVCLDRDEDRTKRVRRAQKSDIIAGNEVVQLEGVEGDWMEMWDMRSKYLRRTKEYYNISFSQFARMFTAKNVKTDEEKEDEAKDDERDQKGDQTSVEKEHQGEKEKPWYSSFHNIMECSHKCCTGKPKKDCKEICCKLQPRKTGSKLTRRNKRIIQEKVTELPDKMCLSSNHRGEGKVMKKRQIPAVLRFHKWNKERNPIKFFLQELILYAPFGLPQNGDMENLLQATDDEINNHYAKYQYHIKEVKSQVMPFLEDVTEERFYVEEIRKQLDTEEIGFQMAPGKEEDNMLALDNEVNLYYITVTGKLYSTIIYTNTIFVEYTVN